MLMFSEDFVDISIAACWLADSLTFVFMLMVMPTCPGHYSDINISISIRRMQHFDILILVIMFMSGLSSLAHTGLLCLCLWLCLCLHC